MDRKKFLQFLTIVPVLPAAVFSVQKIYPGSSNKPLNRVRPGEPGWPSEASWKQLRQNIRGRMTKMKSLQDVCEAKPKAVACAEILNKMQNPFYISHNPALTQAAGWADAWTSAPSVYAIEAEETADIVAAVNFARDHNLRLVVKGGAHSYQGRSCSEDSLLIWTRKMDDVILHDAFVPQGCNGTLNPRPAVSIGAGAIWMDAYNAVTTQAGRYVQGGGCTTIGVAGLIQSGGFGSFSKNYGLAVAGLLEAEIVTADGEVRVANSCTNRDLFWALKGGGGGSFGVVTKLTLRTRELPEYFGGAFGKLTAASDAAFHRLTTRILSFYRDWLFNPHWGEQIRFSTGRSINIQMVFQGLNRLEAETAWQPFLDWVANEQDIFWEQPLQVLALPARHFWNAEFLKQQAPQLIIEDDRPDANEGDFVWAGDQGQAGQYLHGFRSVWLPEFLLEKDELRTLTDALAACCRHWEVSLHFNKGLAGAPENELEAARHTAINPAVLNAFSLAIIGGSEQQVFPGITGREPDMAAARRNAGSIERAMEELLKVVPNPGSYVSESNYFEEDWQQSFWGTNYARLAAVKERYDPGGLFFIHHGVGSEKWSDNGFTRLENH